MGEQLDMWAGSPYRWLRALSSRARGSAGEGIVAGWLEGHGFTVMPPSSTDHDRRVGDVKIEVKLSTLWSSGILRFQQLRDQDYDVVALLGVSPRLLQLWVVPKAVIWQHAVGQHSGAGATETRWLTIDPADPPGWLAPYGGTPQAAHRSSRRLFTGPDPGSGAQHAAEQGRLPGLDPHDS